VPATPAFGRSPESSSLALYTVLHQIYGYNEVPVLRRIGSCESATSEVMQSDLSAAEALELLHNAALKKWVASIVAFGPAPQRLALVGKFDVNTSACAFSIVGRDLLSMTLSLEKARILYDDNAPEELLNKGDLKFTVTVRSPTWDCTIRVWAPIFRKIN
jgi:hypothetical protein